MRAPRGASTGSRWRRAAALILVLAVLGAAVAVFTLQRYGIAPRALAPYVEKRSQGHNRLIVAIGKTAQSILLALDRGTLELPAELKVVLGAQAQAAASPRAPGAVDVIVGNVDQLRAALAGTRAGQVITLLPGRYRVDQTLKASQPGRADAPIIVRAHEPGEVLLEIDTVEGILVEAPYWTFENLHMRGVCGRHDDCEHALHVVGAAHHFAAVNNTIVDFNAHLKINRAGNLFPDHGLIRNNTLTNTAPRSTTLSVVPIDLVAASDWIIERNLITDISKSLGNQVSYGGFAKGAGARNVFRQNMVVCEHRLQRQAGQSVGLSLGGGATGKPFCRDNQCVVEQENSVIRDNLIASCSDVGIYLNSAARSLVEHNTLIDTGGIAVRFSTSSADLRGNLIDGPIIARDNGIVRAQDNRVTSIATLYTGWHPVRSLLRRPAELDFAWNGEAPRRASAASAPVDLCGAQRPDQPAYGAFEDFSACVRP